MIDDDWFCVIFEIEGCSLLERFNNLSQNYGHRIGATADRTAATAFDQVVFIFSNDCDSCIREWPLPNSCPTRALCHGDFSRKLLRLSLFHVSQLTDSQSNIYRCQKKNRQFFIFYRGSVLIKMKASTFKLPPALTLSDGRRGYQWRSVG